VQNSAFYNASPDRDYSGFATVSTSLGYGFAAEDGFAGLGQSNFDEVDPNRRSGRAVITPIVCRNYNQGEFRGRLRHYHLTNTRVGTWQFMRDRSGNWYFVAPYCLRQRVVAKVVFGPMSQALAKPF
jgi:hypothetical protein